MWRCWCNCAATIRCHYLIAAFRSAWQYELWCEIPGRVIDRLKGDIASLIKFQIMHVLWQCLYFTTNRLCSGASEDWKRTGSTQQVQKKLDRLHYAKPIHFAELKFFPRVSLPWSKTIRMIMYPQHIWNGKAGIVLSRRFKFNFVFLLDLDRFTLA